MRFRLLGAVEVEGAGDAALLRRAKVRALLALLLLNANRPVAIDRLITGLWGDDPPDTAVGALQNYVSQLRKTLGAQTVLTRPPGYVIDVGDDELDLQVFRRLTREGAEAAPVERVRLLREALALWRGPALADLRGEPLYEAESGALDALRFAAREQLFHAELDLGAGAGLIAELDEWAHEDPTRETPWAALMLALYRSGRQADALDAYQQARAALDELGLEPGEPLQELQRRILRHDPDLLPEVEADAREIAAPAGGARRTVTVVFVDVSGSTSLASSVDPETLRDVMASFFGEMRGAVERHGGVVEKFSGDEVLAVFGTPTAHEDDALRAVRAASEMQLAVRGLDASLAAAHGVRFNARIGINTGEVVAGRASAGGTFVTGTAVNVGKRLQESAAPGDAVISGATRALVRDAVTVEKIGPVDVRGVDAPVDAFRLVAVDPAAEGVQRLFSTELVGRADELAVLRAAADLARAERRCVRVNVIGAPGIGKTRLARELVAALEGDARILVGRCSAYGDGATYLPLADALGDAFDAAEDETVARLRALLDPAASTAMAADVAFAARAAIRSLARERPVVLVFDDVHWGEPTFLDLIEYLGWIDDASVLLVSLGRTDLLLEHRPEWSDPEVAGPTLRLAPLGDRDTRTLVDHLADDAMAPDERERIARAAEGYPFFAEQLVAWSVETGGLDAAEVPPTVEALLASRLDRLDPGERATLERAAVVGRDFWRGAVAALTPTADLGALNRHLHSLIRKGFVRPAVSELAEEEAFRFHHVLIRDVVYAAIPKAVRAELHERCADWLDEHAGEIDEVVGYHLEQAHRYRRELGPARVASRLAADAGERLGRAGVRALARGDAPAAVSLLQRAVDVLPEHSSLRLELLCELGISQRLLGRADDARTTLERAVAEADRNGSPAAAVRARMERALSRLAIGEGSADEAIEAAKATLKTFEALGDERVLGRAWLTLAFANGSFLSQNAEWEAGLERAIAHYRRARWPTSTCLQQTGVFFYGPRPAREAIARLEELLADDATDAVGQAHVRVWYGALLALQGRFDEARQHVAQARTTFEELSHPINVATSDLVAALIESHAGQHARAEEILRASTERLERQGERALLSNAAAALADALWRQGKYAEALDWSGVARDTTTSSDIPAEFTWRAVRARALAACGRVDEAQELAAAAVELVDRTDAVNQRAFVHLAHAYVLSRAGRVDEAREAAARAQDLFDAKENVVGAASARELGNELDEA